MMDTFFYSALLGVYQEGPRILSRSDALRVVKVFRGRDVVVVVYL